MLKLVLQHLAALGGAIVFGTLFAVAITEALLPPAPIGFIPRVAAVIIYAAWLAAGVYLMTTCVLALKRWCQRRTAPLKVAASALFMTWGVMIGLTLLACALHWID